MEHDFRQYLSSMNKNEISEQWIKASIIGTTWAASEIVLGSFLHNLKIPFSSNLLTGIGIVILISSSYIWKEKGLFWRAGLICALMKTMSPSAVIFGPMVAIFSQAVLLEISTRIFRKTIFGFAIGAMLAMSWNLVQKIINYIIFYGFNIVHVYTDFLKYAQKELHLQFDIVWLPILFLLLIYSFLGFLSAVVGIKVGNKIVQHPAEFKSVNQQHNHFNQFQNSKTQTFNYSIFWLFLNLSFIISALILLDSTSWIVWTATTIIISATWILRYKRALRQLSKPKLWISFVVITMITAFVLNKMHSNSMVNGLLIGLQMNYRAIIIILGFSVLGTELYNPKIREFFLKTSMKQLPLALELSFNSLPMMVANIPNFKVIIKNPVSVIYQLISQIEFRLNDIKKSLSKKIVIITGSIGEGKTSQIQKIVEVLKNQNISIGGILSPRIIENGITTGYDILNISTNERVAFLRKNDAGEQPKIGRYSILSEGLEAGRNALKISQNNNQIVVIDEVGKLELDNKGWAENLNDLTNGSNSNLILSVRDSFAEQVIDKWNLKDCTILRASSNDYEKTIEIITKQLAGAIPEFDKSMNSPN